MVWVCIARAQVGVRLNLGPRNQSLYDMVHPNVKRTIFHVYGNMKDCALSIAHVNPFYMKIYWTK